MAIHKKEFIFSQKGMTRESVRKKVVERFMEEKPGPGEDKTNKHYEYLVEKTSVGDIILTRPANLKLGFDFLIEVPKIVFKKNGKQPNAPSHDNLFSDLKKKYQNNKKYSEDVRKLIIRVYNMEEPNDIIQEVKELNIGYPIELILKISKWFAIEQDIRYWLGWGRMKHVTWLNLLKYYKYNYKIKKMKKGQQLRFFDSTGKELTENKALKIMNSSERQLQL